MSKFDIKKFKKEHGGDSFRMAADIEELDLIPTGILSLDLAIGGWPRKRVIELYGPEGSGKSTLATTAIAEAQKKDLACIYVDLERTYDPKYAEILGVDNSKLLVPKFDTGEQAIDAIEMMITNWTEVASDLDLPPVIREVVIDSIAALLPKSEKNADIGDVHVGLIGRMMSKMSRKFTPILDDYNICMVYINQLRATINSAPRGPRTATTGGNAIKYYATMRVDVRRVGQIKHKEEIVGATVRIMMKKDKLHGKESTNVEIPMYHGKGFSKIEDIVQLSIQKGLTKVGGSWYNYLDNKFQGMDKFKIHLRDNPDILEDLKNKILEANHEE